MHNAVRCYTSELDTLVLFLLMSFIILVFYFILHVYPHQVLLNLLLVNGAFYTLYINF